MLAKEYLENPELLLEGDERLRDKFLFSRRKKRNLEIASPQLDASGMNADFEKIWSDLQSNNVSCNFTEAEETMTNLWAMNQGQEKPVSGGGGGGN